MAHAHEIIDTDKRFVIDPVTRTIVNQSERKVLLMQYDHNSERFAFEVPRYVEGHDMALSTSVQIHYENGPFKGRYDADDVQVSPSDESVVIFSWLISRNATQHAAPLSFLAKFRCYDGDSVVYEWNTAEFGRFSIGEGMDNTDVVVVESHDAIEALNIRMTAVENAPGSAVALERRVEALEGRIAYGDQDMEPDVSELENGKIYLVYE